MSAARYGRPPAPGRGPWTPPARPGRAGTTSPARGRRSGDRPGRPRPGAGWPARPGAALWPRGGRGGPCASSSWPHTAGSLGDPGAGRAAGRPERRAGRGPAAPPGPARADSPGRPARRRGPGWPPRAGGRGGRPAGPPGPGRPAAAARDRPPRAVGAGCPPAASWVAGGARARGRRRRCCQYQDVAGFARTQGQPRPAAKGAVGAEKKRTLARRTVQLGHRRWYR